MKNKIIELTIDVETIDPSEAVLPQEIDGPTVIRITPVDELVERDGVTEKLLVFRIARK
jgi:hypothetical protein